MIDDKDARLSARYRQCSREQPPASMDRAVMELARKSIRRRTLAPFGSHRVAAGALAGISVISLLLVLLLPEPAGVPDLPQSLQDSDEPVAKMFQESRQPESAADEVAAGLEEDIVTLPEPARERFDFYSTLPGTVHETPVEERGVPPPVPPPAGQTASYVLQIEGFTTLAQAVAMQDKLKFMRLDSRIRQDDGTQAGYRVRVGPYTDLDELDRVQAQLNKRGIKTTRERLP